MNSQDERDCREKLLVPAKEYFDILLETLGSDPEKRVAFCPGGKSMLPTLRDRKDLVYLGLPTELKKYDIALYLTNDGRYSLHRLIEILPDGRLVFCGDRYTKLEEPIARANVLAIAYSFKRGKRLIDCRRSRLYRVYSRLWVGVRLARRVVQFVIRPIRRAFRKR